MTVTKTIYQAMTDYLHKEYPDEDIVEVINIEETAQDMGGCETCGSVLEIELYVSYTTKRENSAGYKRGYKFFDDLSLIDWIKRLT